MKYIGENEFICIDDAAKEYGISIIFATKLFSLRAFDDVAVYERNRKFIQKAVFESYLEENGLWGDFRDEYMQYVRNCI